MPSIKEQVLWEHYRAVAEKLGVKSIGSGPPVEQAYSVRWYFSEHSPERNPLTRAFLGDPEAMALVRRGILHPESPEAQEALYGGRGSAPYREEDFLEAGPGMPPPDEAQVEAIEAALAMPVSFIKGPPGNGKTSCILHLLSCILREGMTAAIVSSNNTAVASIEEKLAGAVDETLKNQQALKRAFARLGNSGCRRAFEASHRDMFGGPYRTCADTPSEVFLKQFPIVASTINSLPKCFRDWREAGDGQRREPVYDYVVVDESSQVNTLLGLIAMGGARHLILVGDDDQLPPVIDEDGVLSGDEPEAEAVRAVIGDEFDDTYAIKEDRSFLSVCRRLFIGGDRELSDRCERMLRFHYRCHPGIIGFCRDAVYSDERPEWTMQIRTREYDRTHPTPVRVVWFEGNYREGCTRKTAGRDGREDVQYSRRNRRQAAIFMEEEWPGLLDRLCADPGTVLDLEEPRPLSFCVLSPFRGQLWELREALTDWLADEANRRRVRETAAAHWEEFLEILRGYGVDRYLARHEKLRLLIEADLDAPVPTEELIVDRLIDDLPDRLTPWIPGEDRPVDPMDVEIPELTVHKAQGQEYDIVYFLPVEDIKWERPWFQKRRLINVAVSRAKKELRIIASTALMGEDIQRALTGGRYVELWARDSRDEAESDDDLYLQKLISYVWERGSGPWTDGPFGFHRAVSRSIFDRSVYVGRDRAYRKSAPSAPEICLQDWLRKLPLAAEYRLSVYTGALISGIVDPPEGITAGQETYIENGAHFDCVVCRGDRILLAVEVDGGFHRMEQDGPDRDGDKDAIAVNGLGAARYTVAGGRLVAVEGAAGGTSFDFLRLPTDGSAWNEAEIIEGLLRRRLESSGGPVRTLPVHRLDDLPEDRRRRVFRLLAQPQDWITGRPLERGDPRDNVRWVPTEHGGRAGLMMAYLPGKDGLYPSMVCCETKWNELMTKKL